MANLLVGRKNVLQSRRESDLSLAVKPQADLSPTVNLRYDYEQIPTEHREFVQNVAVDLTVKLERRRRESVAMGKALFEVRDRIDEGLFVEWLTTEFSMSKTTAYNAIAIYERFGGYPEAPKLLTDAAMLKMANPKVPETVVRAVVEEAKSTGKSPSVKRVEEIIAASKPGKKKSMDIVIDKAPSSDRGGNRAGDLLALLPNVERLIAGYEALTGDSDTVNQIRLGIAKIRHELGGQ